MHSGEEGGSIMETEIAASSEAGKALPEPLSRIFDYLPEATMVIDRQGMVIGWNRAMEALTGIKAENMLGRGNYEYSLPLYGSRRPILVDQVINCQPAEGEYRTLVEREGTVSSENFCPGVGGNGAYLQFSAAAFYDDNGQILGGIQSFRDITEKRRTEEELLRIKKAVESASSAIWITDSKGQKVIYHNQAFADLFKYNGDDLNTLGGTRSLYVDIRTADLVYRTHPQGRQHLERGNCHAYQPGTGSAHQHDRRCAKR